MLWYIISTIISGALIGWLAGLIMHADNGFWINAVIGIVGSAIASFLCWLIGIYSYGFIFGLIADVAGACLLIWLVRRFMNR